MMEPFVPFGGAAYGALFGLVLLGRGADFLSTWVASPTLQLEANPVARALGWRWGVGINLGAAALVAHWPLPAIMVATASLLVAARNFQSAWLSRGFGESAYGSWLRARLEETPRGLFVVCVAAQAILLAAVGSLLIFSSPAESVATAVGFGLVTYAAAVLVFPLLAARRLWRSSRTLA